MCNIICMLMCFYSKCLEDAVYGCRSNYDGEEATTTFSLPKDTKLRDLWLKKIPTDLSHLKHPIICIKHFEETFIVRRDKVVYKGEVKEYERERPKLTENAVPSIFPSCPSYLNANAPKVRRLADVENEQFETAIQQSLETLKSYNSQQSVSSISDLVSHLENNKLPQDWIYYSDGDNLHVCLMDLSDSRPYVSASVNVSKDLNVNVFFDKSKVSLKYLPIKLPIIKTLREFDSLISYVSENRQKDNSKCDFEFALDIIKSSEQYKELESLQFCVEQIILSDTPKQSRRYGNQTMILAACLFAYSPSAYNALLKSGLLFLPHPRNLRKLICNFDLSMSSLNSSAEYLKGRVKYLKPQELVVNLILDEIYIQPQLSFKGGHIYGSSSNDTSKIAKTVQVFMVSSVFSKYKDVVTLIPVNNMTSEYLKNLILSLISVLEDIGFKILALVSDNNSINRRAFELMTGNKILQSSIPHPLDNSRTLFFLFDTVHILKCIRNNWVNKRNDNRSIKYLDMKTNKTLIAQYHHLELMYEMEKSSLLKFGHTLSEKVLHPSNIQKQNVNLALKIFNENNIVALKHIAKHHPHNFQCVESTCNFIEIVVNWWKIVNVKNVFEGKRFNDKFRDSIKKDSDMQINFLRNLSMWLKNWRQTVPIADALSSQTFQALIITTDSFLKIIPYIFTTYNVDYILLGKFQSDNLESRFSSYRQLSGANYYITYIQVLENERKIRFKNTVLFSLKHKNIPLKTLMPLNADTYVNNSEEKLEIFNDLIEADFNFESVPDSVVPILTVIGGYSVRKILRKKQCSICVSWLQLNKSIDTDEIYEFLRDKDRGKLTLPSGIVVFAAGITWHTMNCLIEYSEFSSIKNHLNVLHKIATIKLEREDDLLLFEECMCKATLVHKLKEVCCTVSKILINNYTKEINSQSTSMSFDTSRKVKKLKS